MMEFGERWDCPACGESNTRSNTKCYACGASAPGKAMEGGGQPPAAPALVKLAPGQGVKIVDIDLSIGSMATLMLKMLVAAIPVAIVIGVASIVGSILFTLFMARLNSGY